MATLIGSEVSGSARRCMGGTPSAPAASHSESRRIPSSLSLRNALCITTPFGHRANTFDETVSFAEAPHRVVNPLFSVAFFSQLGEIVVDAESFLEVPQPQRPPVFVISVIRD